MKYSLMEIRRLKTDGSWYVTNQKLSGERHNEKQKPKPVGFYYYPTRKSEKKAFDELKKCMISELEKEIQLRKQAILELEGLHYGVATC